MKYVRNIALKFPALPMILAVVLIAGTAMGLYAVERITIKGSDTMVILAQRWAERYMEHSRGVSIQVTGGGSGTGIAALINGTTDICNASRPITPEEALKLRERYGVSGVQVTVARDGLMVYLNKSNPVENLTLEQLRGIYTGVITNWSEVGGPDHKIIVYGRENNSGTYAYFLEEVLQGKAFSSSVQSLPGTSAVVHAIAKDKYGVGYGGTAYAAGIKAAMIEGVSPTKENVAARSYPLGRDLYIYMRFQPSGKTKRFIDWVLSPEGQKIVRDVGYYPIR